MKARQSKVRRHRDHKPQMNRNWQNQEKRGDTEKYNSQLNTEHRKLKRATTFVAVVYYDSNNKYCKDIYY